MKSYLKTAVTVAASMYVGAGLFAGLMMQRAIPALNPLGVAVIAATWPNQIRCARVSDDCEPIPSWLGPYVFSFPARAALREDADHG